MALLVRAGGCWCAGRGPRAGPRVAWPEGRDQESASGLPSRLEGPGAPGRLPRAQGSSGRQERSHTSDGNFRLAPGPGCGSLESDRERSRTR